MAQSNSVVITLSARDEASRVIDRMRGSLTAASAAGNILADVVTNTVSKAFQGLTNSISEASDIQLNNITGAGTFAALTGKSYGEATKFVDKMNLGLAKTAATLPGTTQGYKDIALGIMDNLLPAFQDANGVVNEGDFLKGITNITTGLGVLGAASGVASSDISKFAGKFMGGSSMSELSQLLFAEANPAFLSVMQRKLDASGKKLEQLTVKERATILEAVQKELVTPEVIAAASNSLGGLMEGLSSSLFEQTTGMFGLLRDLDEETDGDQTVFGTIQRIFIKLFGTDGVFPTIANILKDLKIDIDPMKALAAGLGKLGNFLDGLKKFLHLIDDAGLGDIPYELGTKVGEFINGLIDPSKAGEHAATMGKLIWNGIKGFTEALGYAIASLDTTGVAVIAGGILTTTVVIPWITGLATKMLIATSAASLGPIALLAAAAGLVIINLGRVIIENWPSIQAEIEAGFKGIISGFVTAFEGVKKIVTGIVTLDGKKIQDGISDLFKVIMSPIRTAINIARNLAGLPGLEDQANLNDAAEAAEAKYNWANLNKNGLTLDIPGGVGNAASGMNYSNLLSAARREANNAPSGSSLVMANSSEAILNKAQQAQLMSSMGNKGGITIGNITINTQATDAKGIAKDIMAQINYEFNKYSQGYIAAPVS